MDRVGQFLAHTDWWGVARITITSRELFLFSICIYSVRSFSSRILANSLNKPALPQLHWSPSSLSLSTDCADLTVMKNMAHHSTTTCGKKSTWILERVPWLTISPCWPTSLWVEHSWISIPATVIRHECVTHCVWVIMSSNSFNTSPST